MSRSQEEGAGESPIELIAEVDDLSASRQDLRVMRMQQFEAPLSLSGDELEEYRRRFVTLFVDEGYWRKGGIGKVAQAKNAMGETFALKLLVVPALSEVATDDELKRQTDSLELAFRQEYECHRALSGLKGVPRLYGYGKVGGVPAIIMEWIEGETLERARTLLAVDEHKRLSPLTAARIGRDLFELFERMALMGDGFVHRDISLSNVMVRTSRLSVREQADEGVFELCLIDFGSSSPALVQGTSFTNVNAVARKATADYAPPEMLSDDMADVERLRKSPAIDVYAGGSILYDLMCGCPPFVFSDAAFKDMSAYRVKTERPVARPMMVHASADDIGGVLLREPEVAVALEHAASDLATPPDEEEVKDALAFVDEQLADLVLACLTSHQDDRPNAADVHGALAAFCRQYIENVDRSLHGEQLLPCTLDGVPRGSAVSVMSARAMVRSVGKAISAGVWLVVIAATGILVDGLSASFAFGPLSWDGYLSGLTVSASLALPGLLGIAGRGRSTDSFSGFIRGSILLAVGSLVVLGIVLGITPYPSSAKTGLMAAWFAAVAAGWCPLVVDYALATILPSPRTPSRKGLPSSNAEGQAALPGEAKLPPDMEGEGRTGFLADRSEKALPNSPVLRNDSVEERS